MAKKFRLGKLPKEFIDDVMDGAQGDLEDALRRIKAGIPKKYNVGSRVERNRAGRPSGIVALMEPNGVLIEAKHGDLARSAAQQGLDVHRYKG